MNQIIRRSLLTAGGNAALLPSAVRVFLVLSILVCGFALADASEPARRRVVILGDSLAAGFGVEPSESFPSRLQERVDQAGLPFEIVNAGVSGDTTSGGLRRVDWVLKQPVDCLILELGGNDGLRGISPDVTRSNLVAILGKTRVRWPDAALIVAGMRMPNNVGQDYQTAFASVFPAAAKAGGAVLIPFLLEGVGGVPELNQPDQIHPNPTGHRQVAALVWKTLEPILRERVPSVPPKTAPAP